MTLLDEKLLRSLARSAERQVSDLNVQNLSSLVWAFATAKLAKERLFKVLARATEERIDEFHQPFVRMTFWGLLIRKWFVLSGS